MFHLVLVIFILILPLQAHATTKKPCEEAMTSGVVTMNNAGASIYESLANDPNIDSLAARRLLMALTVTPVAVPNIVGILHKINSHFDLNGLELGEIVSILQTQSESRGNVAIYSDPLLGELLHAIVSSEEAALYIFKTVTTLLLRTPVAVSEEARILTTMAQKLEPTFNSKVELLAFHEELARTTLYLMNRRTALSYDYWDTLETLAKSQYGSNQESFYVLGCIDNLRHSPAWNPFRARRTLTILYKRRYLLRAVQVRIQTLLRDLNFAPPQP